MLKLILQISIAVLSCYFELSLEYTVPFEENLLRPTDLVLKSAH